jgi:sulfoxide reductase heme-binding subunit YedZ
MKIITALLALLQREVLRRRLLLTRLLKISEWFVFIGYMVIWGMYSSGQLKSVSLLLDIGRKLGTLAFVFYVLTLLPSMIPRLKFPQLFPIMSILLPFRRQFGVLMFLLAFAHQGFTTILPNLIFIDFDYSKLAPQLSAHHIAGYAAWWLLFPLWLTSNDAAIKYTGKWWKRIHKLTYVAIFAIMAHLVLVDHWMYAVILGGILVVNGWGLVRKGRR